MKGLTIVKIFFTITLLCSGQAFAWTVSADFESGAVGSRAQGTSGFTEAGSQTVFSSDRAASGAKSAKMTWIAGNEGWGVAHGYLDYPNVSNGSEIWARGYFYFASPWSWSCSPVVKILRGVHIANSGGGNVGYHSILADSSGNILLSNEPADHQPSTGVKFDLDKWQCIEMYVKLSTTDPIFRIWKNGVLIYEDKSHITLRSANDYADYAYIMTNWNGGAPRAQTQYVDDFVITNQRPSAIDAKGNPMIGTGSADVPTNTPPEPVPIEPPQPPTGLKIQTQK